MILTDEPDLDTVKLNHHVKHLHQTLFCLKLLPGHIGTHSQPTTLHDHKMAGKKSQNVGY